MKILYVSQYFPPEMGAPSARVHELSREWVKEGHQVTVLTAFANHPTGIKSPNDRWKITRRERKEGIDIVRTYIYAAPNRGIARRMLSYASFMLSAVVIGSFRVARPDVIIATSPQLLCAASGYLLSLRFRRPFIFEVRDLWPESILAVKAMGDNLLVQALKGLARFLYKESRLIVAVGRGYQRQIMELYGISAEKIKVVPNGFDPGLFVPGPSRNPTRKKWKWGNKKVVLYLGTLGMAHGLRTALETASILKKRKDIHFVFVGEGGEKATLKLLAARWELFNVEFIDQQSKERVVELYQVCDLGLVMLRNTPLFQDVLPSKIFEYLAMERPIVITVGGEARKLVEESGGGVYTPPEDAKKLAAAIDRLVRQPKKLKRMGQSGRKYVLRHFNRMVLAQKYLDILTETQDKTR